MIRLRPGWCLALSLAAVTTLTTGCTTVTPQPQPLVIGLLAPLTGPAAATGADALRGAELAIDMVNRAYPAIAVPLAAGTGLPGLRGAPLALAAGDTAGRTDEATAQVTALVSDRHAVGLVMSESAEITAAAGSQVQRLRVPLLDARSTADYLTELGADWYFRTGPSDTQLADSAFALLGRQPGPAGGEGHRVVLVTEAGAGADGAAAAVWLRELAMRGGTTVETQLDMSAGAELQLSGTDKAGRTPDAVFGWAQTAQGAAAIIAAAEQSHITPLYGLGQGFRQLDRPPSQDPGLLRAMPWSAEYTGRNPVARDVALLYQERYGRPMTGAAADSFTAVLTLAKAVDEARSDDPAAIRTALRQTALPATQLIMPWNGVRFGADGQNTLAAAVVEQWQFREFRLVYPIELSTATARWARQDADW